MNKKSITILVLFLAIVCIFTIVFVLIVLNNSNKNQNINTNKITNNIKQNKNINSNINQPKKIDYSGELTKEANGWKKYKNEYWGVEFRFMDEKDEMKVAEWSVGVIVVDSKTEDPYIYINIYCYDDRDFDNFQDYIEKNKIWDPGLGAPAPAVTKLVSIKEKINKNNTKYLRVDFKYSEFCYPGERCDTKTLYDNFVVFFKSPIHDNYCKKRNYVNTGYINIRNASDNNIYQQIINSLNFIKK
ncbi:hypothetical protein K8R61_02125 [bacterium]|nr:hypothetical protein [bacterium]